MKAFKIHWPSCALASLAFLAMLLECLRGTASPIAAFGGIRDDIIDIVLSKLGQFMILPCLLSWHLALLWLKTQNHTGSPARKWHEVMTPGEICKVLLIVSAVVAYTRNGSSADPPSTTGALLLGIDQSTNLLVLVLGIVVSDIAGVLVKPWDKGGDSVRRSVLTSLIAFLAIGSVAQTNGRHSYIYRAQVRWTGLWVNPNTFGLLMAVGQVIALGLIHGTLQPGRWRLRRAAVYAAVGVATGIGLLHSYSRGAWVAFGCGLLTLGLRANAATASSVPKAVSWLRRSVVPLSVIACSAVLIAYWQFHDTQHQIVRRVLSVRNENDFSSRNRLAAYEGALQMTAEQPWLGFGWNQSEMTYTQYYRPADVEEGMAIQLNDYFTLATTLGLPALLGFVAYVGLSLGLKPRRERKTDFAAKVENPATEETRISSICAACRAGVVVLLVGFFFDGGLFKIALSVPFWILLELGSEGNRD